MLHVPRHKVVVQSPRMGGGFGGKETQGNTWAALAALAAVRTRPARARAAQPRPGHDPHRQAAPVSRAVRGGLRRRTAPCAPCAWNSSPTAAGRSTCRAPSPTARCSTSTTPITFRTSISAGARSRRTSSRTRPFAASAGRRGCSSSRRSSTASRATSACRRKQVRERNLYHGTRRDEHDPLRPGDRRQPPAHIWHTLKDTSSVRRAARGDRRVERRASPCQTRVGHHAGQVRHHLYHQPISIRRARTSSFTRTAACR